MSEQSFVWVQIIRKRREDVNRVKGDLRGSISSKSDATGDAACQLTDREVAGYRVVKTATRTMNGIYVKKDTAAMIRHLKRHALASRRKNTNG